LLSLYWILFWFLTQRNQQEKQHGSQHGSQMTDANKQANATHLYATKQEKQYDGLSTNASNQVYVLSHSHNQHMYSATTSALRLKSFGTRLTCTQTKPAWCG
jgi:hypothetical protein